MYSSGLDKYKHEYNNKQLYEKTVSWSVWSALRQNPQRAAAREWGLYNTPDPASQTFFSVSIRTYAPATAETFQAWQTDCGTNRCPVQSLFESHPAQLTGLLFTPPSWLWKTTPEIQRLMGRFSISSLEICFFDFSVPGVTGSDKWPWNWMKLKWIRSCQ